MNEFQPQIERLVDGELPFDEEAALLKSFEHQPAGWRQLALAFLEDRTFRAALPAGAIDAANAVPPSSSAAARTMQSPTGAARVQNAFRICAASLLLLAAFLTGRFSTPAGHADPDRIVADSNPRPDSEQEQQPENNIPDAPAELPPPIEFVSLNVGAEGEDARTVDVPLLPWDQVSEAAELNEINPPPPLIPAEIREILARRGQTVRESIDYYQFQLSDGRVGVIPVSNVEIQANTWPPIQ